MRRYLDIIREMKSNRNIPPPVVSLTNWGVRKNEINEKSRLAIEQRVRWNREVSGRVVLASGNGWVVVQCDPVDLVFLRVDKLVRVERGSASC
jgi:hypothetical protein